MKSSPRHDSRPELAQFGGHRIDAIGLLDAPAGDVRQARRALGIESHHGERHCRVGDVIAVELDRTQRPAPAPHLEPARPARDLRAHGRGGFDEADVALDRIAARAFDAQPTPAMGGDGAECDEVGRRRRIALDVDLARRSIPAVCRSARNGEALPAVALDADAEPCQQVQRDLDIGLGDQFALDQDDQRRCARHQRQRQQQGRQELARHVAAHADRLARIELAAAQAQRRIAWLTELLDAAAERAQRVDEVADRALVHARDAPQFELAALGCGEHGQCGGQWAHRRAGIAEEEAGPVHGQAAREAGDAHAAGLRLDRAAEPAQCFEHDLRVVGVEQAVQRRRSGAQAGQQQHAVGDALRARQPHIPRGARQRWEVEKRGVVHGAGRSTQVALSPRIPASAHSSARRRARRTPCAPGHAGLRRFRRA